VDSWLYDLRLAAWPLVMPSTPLGLLLDLRAAALTRAQPSGLVRATPPSFAPPRAELVERLILPS
jgi:hypothetical protein